jgi:pentatricopeptide repeat protein
MISRNFIIHARTKQEITSYIFGTIRYIFNFGTFHSCNDIFFSKIYHKFFPTNLLIFKIDQQNRLFYLPRARKCGSTTSNFIPELHTIYNKKPRSPITTKRFSTPRNGSTSSSVKTTTNEQENLRLNVIINELSSKKRAIQRFFKARKHFNLREELSSKKSTVNKFSKIRKRIFDKNKEYEHNLTNSYTGIKTRNIIRYRFQYPYESQEITPTQRKLIKERSIQWKKRMDNMCIREIKRNLVSLEKRNIEMVYSIIEKILYKPKLLDNLNILEIRKLVKFFSKKNPLYAITILEAVRDYEFKLEHQDYSMMLKLYRVLENNHIGAMYTLEVLKNQGFNPSKEDYFNLLRVIIIKGVSLKQVFNYIEEMASKDYQVDHYINSLIINRLIELNNITAAGKIFMDMISKGQVTHGLILPDIFKKQDESLGDLSLYVTIYSVLIQTFINQDHYNKAVEFYRKLLNKYSIPDIQIVEIMISACLVRNDIKVAQEFLINTQTPNINHIYFNTMKHCIKNRNFKDLFKLYEISWYKNITFTEREYHDLIYSLCIEECATDSFIIYKDARSKGFLKEDLFIFNKLLKIMIKYEKIKEMKYIKKDMENLKIKPNIETYRIMIQLAAIQGVPEKYETIFQEIYRAGLSIDYTTFSCLIKSFADSGNLEKAKKALNLMFQSDFRPTINDYNNLIRAAGKSTNYDVKSIGITILRDSNREIEPNIDTYNCFLESYLSTHFLSVAKKVYRTIIKDGLEFNLETFHVFFKHCCKIRGYKEAFELFYDQLEYNKLEPSIYTWNLLINKAIESKSSKIIRKIYDELYNRGIKLNNTLLYIKLVIFWGYEKEYNKVEDIIDHMRIGRIDNDVLIDSITEFINIYIIHKQYDKAENLWNLFQHEKLIPNENLYNSLIKLYTNLKDDNKLQNIYKIMN